jgi:hypothetical protein
VSWEDRIPHIADGNVRWAVLWVHGVEAYYDFDESAAEMREIARTNPERRAVYLEAYRYLLDHVPSPREWAGATSTPFCTREQLREYLQAFVDYVFGDRPAPIEPPENDQLCEHERNEDGVCVLSAAETAAEESEEAEDAEAREDGAQQGPRGENAEEDQ